LLKYNSISLSNGFSINNSYKIFVEPSVYLANKLNVVVFPEIELLHNDIREPLVPPLPVIVSDVKGTEFCIKNLPPLLDKDVPLI
jgi:hypothetical protein